jgi:hypothetical protein
MHGQQFSNPDRRRLGIVEHARLVGKPEQLGQLQRARALLAADHKAGLVELRVRPGDVPAERHRELENAVKVLQVAGGVTGGRFRRDAVEDAGQRVGDRRALKRFAEKWIPVFRKEMRQTQETKALPDRRPCRRLVSPIGKGFSSRPRLSDTAFHRSKTSMVCGRSGFHTGVDPPATRGCGSRSDLRQVARAVVEVEAARRPAA